MVGDSGREKFRMRFAHYVRRWVDCHGDASLDFAAVQRAHQVQSAGGQPVYADGADVGCHREIQGENGYF